MTNPFVSCNRLQDQRISLLPPAASQKATSADPIGKRQMHSHTAEVCASRLRLTNSLFFPALLVLLAGAIFSPHLFGQRIFIGDADRLDCHLNMRLHQHDGLRETGRVPAWNDRMFNGFSTTGLHWMIPEADPFGYVAALFPREQVNWISGVVTCLFFAAAALAIYYCVNDYAKCPPASFIAAISYVASCASYTRICQVDSTYAVLIFAPLGVRAVRKMQVTSAASSYISMFVVIFCLLMFTFLQEAAYVIGLFALFATFRALKFRKPHFVLLFALSLATAAMTASPRILSILEEFSTFNRTNALQGTDSVELIRFFNEGVFGRYPAEAREHQNGINLHEGLQLYSSTFASILMLVGFVRTASRMQFLGSAMLVGSLFAVLAFSRPFPVWTAACLAPALLFGLLMSCQRQWREIKCGHSDFVFHATFVGVTFVVVLVPEVRSLLHQLFFSIDFTHSRVVVAALTPMSILLAMCLVDWLAYFSVRKESARLPSYVVAAAIASAVVLSSKLIADQLVTNLQLPVEMQVSDRLNALTAELIQVFIAIIALILLFSCRWIIFHGALRSGCACSLGVIIVLQCIFHLFYQLWGDHTLTYPRPFLGNNFLTVERHCFQPPSSAAAASMQSALQSRDYRSAIVAHPSDYGAYVEPHIAQFWGLRLLGGYCAGVPRRLTALPWKDGVVGLRTISFPTEGSICWGLLAMLNTKYVVNLTPEFYSNSRVNKGRYLIQNLEKATNGLDVLPRAFFAAQVRPMNLDSILESFKQERNANEQQPVIAVNSVNIGAITVEWRAVFNSNGHVSIERKDGDNGKFREVGTVPLTSRTHCSFDLDPSLCYAYRVRFFRDGKYSEYSNEEATYPAAEIAPKPENVTAKRISDNAAVVRWKSQPGWRYIVESIASEGNPDRRTIEISAASAHQLDGDQSSAEVHDLGPSATAFRIRATNGVIFSAHTEATWILPAPTYKSEDWRRFENIVGSDFRKASLAEGIGESEVFSTEGDILTMFEHDTIYITLSPSKKRRFLVLNELFHPAWRAVADGKPLTIMCTNVCMRGIIVPPGTTSITLCFVPFLYSNAAMVVSALGGLLFVTTIAICRAVGKRQG